MSRAARPIFLNPLRIAMPVGALTSIAHRVSGILLAFSTPFGVYLLGLSLRNEQGFKAVSDLMSHSVVKVAVVTVAWALSHHVLAGVRHLLSDMNVGSTLRSARKTAYAANVGGLAIALIVVVLLW